jgi:hypothetical protein
MALENALEVKVKENAALMESMSNMESTHAKDLEVSCIAAGHLLSRKINTKHIVPISCRISSPN